jgi:hypothetical protein
MSYFQRCFLRLFHCRVRNRDAGAVVGRRHIMPRDVKQLLKVGSRAARRLRLAKSGTTSVTDARSHSAQD